MIHGSTKLKFNEYILKVMKKVDRSVVAMLLTSPANKIKIIVME
jgi:hypothetical protein